MSPLRKQGLLWLILVPLPLGLTLASVFLGLLLSSAFSSTSFGISVLAGIYLLGSFIYFQQISDALEPLQWAVKHESEVSASASESLQLLVRRSFTYWLACGGLVAVLGPLLVLPSFLGVLYFGTAGLITAGFGCTWSYFTVKLIIVGQIRRVDEFHYEGRVAPIGRKVALIFLGIFSVSALAFFLLGSAQIASTLEELAINSQTTRFQELEVLANSALAGGELNLEVLDSQIPPGFRIARILPSGEVQGPAAETLTERDIGYMRNVATGDSTRYISPNVARFTRLDDGSSLVMTIPWAPYQEVTRQIAIYGLIVAVLSLIQFSITIFYFARDTDRPLKALGRTASELAAGDFRGRIRVFADDEIGELARNFRNSRDRLRGLLRSVTTSGSQVRDTVRVITKGSASLLDQASQQALLATQSSDAITQVQGQSGKILEAAEKVSTATQGSASRALQLRASAEEVSKRADELFQSVEKTSTSTTQMSASATEMQNRTSVLASVGEEVLSFVAEMDSTVRELRTVAERSAEISREVRENAESGGEAVQQTVEGIQSAQESTRRSAQTLDELREQIGQISRILTVIEDVTERTNLLSLNAAIIAAQAGEHGLGFSVVAEEIRQLAERTRGSTKEIGGIIRAVEAASGEAVEAMNEGVSTVEYNVSQASSAAEALEKILASANASFEMASRMARSLQEQASASQRLHEVTSRMSDNITEINRSTQEQARSTHLLAQESEKVSEIAAQVKNSTIEQREAGRGIGESIEQISSDAAEIRDLLEQQLVETESVSEASELVRSIAAENEALAKEFASTVETLREAAAGFENELSRFQL